MIELTETSRLKTIEELKTSTGKAKRGMDGQSWGRLTRIAFGYVNLKNIGAVFNLCLNLYGFLLSMVGNHLGLLCGRDIANKRLFLCQNYLKYSDLAPLIMTKFLFPLTSIVNFLVISISLVDNH